jgi:hypothetical protein
MATIGLIAMSAKPFHAGHDGLVRWAAKENDEVHLYVSLSDRMRPGELPILGSDMEQIWKRFIEPSLPGNVRVTYGGSPVRNVYEDIGEANEAGDTEDIFTIYADPEDLAQNFPEKSLDKYAGNLFHNGQIILKPIERTQTVNVSGTKMRQFLSTGDKKGFIANLPKEIDREAVWNILSAPKAPAAPAKKPAAKKLTSTKVRGEALIRDFVSRYLKG